MLSHAAQQEAEPATFERCKVVHGWTLVNAHAASLLRLPHVHVQYATAFESMLGSLVIINAKGLLWLADRTYCRRPKVAS